MAITGFRDIGRLFFCAAVLCIGIEPFVTGHLPMALTLPPAHFPSWAAMLIGGLLAASALAAILRPQLPAVALTLLAFPVLDLLLAHLPRLAAAPRDAVIWSGVFQVVAFCAGPLFLVKPKLGRIVFAVALAVFGIQHFMYAGFVASLVPSWIPFPLFWAWASGTAFIAVSISAVTNRATNLSGTLLGLMFSSWVLIVHLPRIAATPGSEPGWTSGLVALACAGIAFMLAGSAAPVDAPA